MRHLHILALACLLASSCGGNNNQEGDADADDAADTTTETTADTLSEPAVDPTTEPTSDPTEDPTTEIVDDPTTDPDEETDADEDPTTDPATDHAGDDATLTCDTSKMHSAGIAATPWGVGSFCDEIYACISSGAASVVTSIFPSATCGTTFSSCSSADVCQIYTGGTLTTSDYADMCALSLQDTVAAIYCIVYG